MMVTTAVARKKMNDEAMIVRVPAGVRARIEAVLRGRELQSDFLRETVIKELERRERVSASRPRRND